MPNCFDVAKYILCNIKLRSISIMRLHKLLYYAQAWSLAWDQGPLFKERIEAWVHGPVVPKIYRFHKGKYELIPDDMPGSIDNLTQQEKDCINRVLGFYANAELQWLSDLICMEDPWNKARKGLPADVRGKNKISHASMKKYYASLITS